MQHLRLKNSPGEEKRQNVTPNSSILVKLSVVTFGGHLEENHTIKLLRSIHLVFKSPVVHTSKPSRNTPESDQKYQLFFWQQANVLPAGKLVLSDFDFWISVECPDFNI